MTHLPEPVIGTKTLPQVMCLLDEDLEKSGEGSMVQRLTSSLASCAQLSQLQADKRTWALQHLRGVMALQNCPKLNIQEIMQNQIKTTDGVNNSLGNGRLRDSTLFSHLLAKIHKLHSYTVTFIL